MLAENTILRAEKVIGRPPTAAMQPIALCGDAKYVFAAGVLMASILKSNPEDTFSFHLFVDTLRPDDELRLEALAEAYPATSIHIYFVDERPLSAFATREALSAATYYRLFVPFLVKTAKILYLDADMLCTGSLRELWQEDFSGMTALVVTDEPELAGKLRQAVPEFTADKYFNAGMLYIDVEKWLATDNTEKVLDFLMRFQTEYLDQDALNMTLAGKVKFLDPRYNYRYVLARHTHTPPAETALIHFTTPHKPWLPWLADHPLSRLWLAARESSPWRDLPLPSPRTGREARRMAKYHWRVGQYAKAVSWLGQYLKLR
jgi:lipopolysaccharide biosynthesis glycosyltransferase